MVVLVTGANGQLGQALQSISGNYSEIDFIFCDSTRLDITDLNNIKLAVIGVKENRGAHIEVENTKLSHIRKELYGLYHHFFELKKKVMILLKRF